MKTTKKKFPRGSELARQAFNHIVKHPTLWRQEWWVTEVPCGTAYCFGGWCEVLGNGVYSGRLMSSSVCALLGLEGNSKDGVSAGFENNPAYLDGEPVTPFEATNRLSDLRKFVVKLMKRDGNKRLLLPCRPKKAKTKAKTRGIPCNRAKP